MTTTKTMYLALLAVLLSPIVANAGLIRLEAASLYPSDLSDFTIIFDDTGDGLLQWEEITGFSGVEVLSSERIAGVIFDPVDVVPTILGVSTFSWDPSFPVTPFDYWRFGNEGEIPYLVVVADAWSYSLISVPEPGALALFGIGLLGMGLARRKDA